MTLTFMFDLWPLKKFSDLELPVRNSSTNLKAMKAKLWPVDRKQTNRQTTKQTNNQTNEQMKSLRERGLGKMDIYDS